jgi:hypothetical protein
LSVRIGADDVDASFGPGRGDDGRLLSASNCGDERWLSLLSPDFGVDVPVVLAFESTEERDVILIGAMTWVP